jgi:hypothetical protein
MAVTQPPWPLRTPLSLSCSPILKVYAGKEAHKSIKSDQHAPTKFLQLMWFCRCKLCIYSQRAHEEHTTQSQYVPCAALSDLFV